MFLLHWTPEGQHCKIGFNFRGALANSPYFKVIWYNYDPASKCDFGWYWRVCFNGRLHFCYEQQKPRSVIETWLFDLDLVTISRVVYKDFIEGHL